MRGGAPVASVAGAFGSSKEQLRRLGGVAAQPRVASAAHGRVRGSLPREGDSRSLRRQSVAAVSCVRNRALRRAVPWRCGDVEILCFGVGFEHHPVGGASLVGFGRSGCCRRYRLRLVRAAVAVSRGSRPAARRRAGFASRFRNIELRFGALCHLGGADSGPRPRGLGAHRFGGAGLAAESPFGKQISTVGSLRTGTGASAPAMGRTTTVASAARVANRQNTLEASVCSFDARGFGSAPSISEILLQSRVPEDCIDLRGATLRRRFSGDGRASACAASGTRRPRVARRIEFARFEVGVTLHAATLSLLRR